MNDLMMVILISLLGHNEFQVRENAYKTIEQVMKKQHVETELLFHELNSPDPEVRHRCASLRDTYYGMTLIPRITSLSRFLTQDDKDNVVALSDEGESVEYGNDDQLRHYTKLWIEYRMGLGQKWEDLRICLKIALDKESGR